MYPGVDQRVDYQTRYIDFQIQPGMSVLDIGSGGEPFPHATILAERFLQPKFRYEALVTNDKPLVVSDIHHLPFSDKYFDFVYASHVLQNTEDPVRASLEIMRVGKRGYIETPTFGKDALFAWARNIQRWHVCAIGPRLCFFEYTERQLDGINSNVWRDLINGRKHHPLQDAFWNNQDIFNVMFLWERPFSVVVFYLDGSVQTLNA
ncbi:MAG TPA: class I SAM-dependent methyltransferase [Terriglobia bacterium]|nr:class I SAM-dependent methyltransferase [Terriglobia bacterium]